MLGERMQAMGRVLDVVTVDRVVVTSDMGHRRSKARVKA